MKPAYLQQHFLNPRNVGDVENPTATGKAGSFVCGGTLRITLKISEVQTIQEAKFRAAGCSYLVAVASVLTEELKNHTTGAAAALVNGNGASVLSEYGSLPTENRHCAELASEALISAIKQYSDSVRDEWEGDEALICTCFCVSERTIENEIRIGGLKTISEVTRACNAGAGCRSCYSLIEDILGEVNSKW